MPDRFKGMNCSPLVQYIADNVSGRTFIDVGAHVGGFCIPLLLNSDFEKCYAFEPNPWANEQLRVNVEKYNVDVEIIDKALLHGTGTVTLKVPVEHKDKGLSTIGKPLRFKEWDDVVVDATSLDTCDIEGVDFIKMDTEGAELFVILGAKNYLKKHSPPVLFELQAKNTFQLGYDPLLLLRELSSLGYWFQAVSKGDYMARAYGF